MKLDKITPGEEYAVDSSPACEFPSRARVEEVRVEYRAPHRFSEVSGDGVRVTWLTPEGEPVPESPTQFRRTVGQPNIIRPANVRMTWADFLLRDDARRRRNQLERRRRDVRQARLALIAEAFRNLRDGTPSGASPGDRGVTLSETAALDVLDRLGVVLSLPELPTEELPPEPEPEPTEPAEEPAPA